MKWYKSLARRIHLRTKLYAVVLILIILIGMAGGTGLFFVNNIRQHIGLLADVASPLAAITNELIASKPLMMGKCHAQVDHGIGQQPKPVPGFFEPIVADAESAGGILPPKGPFHLIPFAIDGTVEPSECPGKSYRLRGVSAVGVHDRDQPIAFDERLVGRGITAGITRQG